ncbi:hypothetical protein GCM10023209_34320 [Roseibacterium beibuensis]|uniref:Uncharacterized protein n=1 Tax=[Roseibacterium] beibuensis TaxID=1193142 RepID=A0ABP9LM18_9RHOB
MVAVFEDGKGFIPDMDETRGALAAIAALCLRKLVLQFLWQEVGHGSTQTLQMVVMSEEMVLTPIPSTQDLRRRCKRG